MDIHRLVHNKIVALEDEAGFWMFRKTGMTAEDLEIHRARAAGDLAVATKDLELAERCVDHLFSIAKGLLINK